MGIAEIDAEFELEKRLPSIINTSWCYSWYWDGLKDTGHLSLQGWRDALKDAIQEHDYCRDRAAVLQKAIERITAVIDRRERLEREGI